MLMQSSKKEMHQRDYSLSGQSSITAIENGLAEADWYRSRVPRDQIRLLLERRNGPAILDTLLWFTTERWSCGEAVGRHSLTRSMPCSMRRHRIRAGMKRVTARRSRPIG